MERSLIRDGVYELMSELQYQYWAGKPKNGGLVAAQASAKWQQLFDAPGAVTDLLGDNPAYAARFSGFEPPPSLFRSDSVMFRPGVSRIILPVMGQQKRINTDNSSLGAQIEAADAVNESCG